MSTAVSAPTFAPPRAGRLFKSLFVQVLAALLLGIAVGVASALPVSIERIAKWAKAAEGRGVLLVPITAVSNKAKSS